MDLHMRSAVISIHNKIEVLSDNDEVMYRVHSKALSVHDKTYLEDANGNELAYIHQKAVSIHHVHYIEMVNGENFELTEQLFHVKDIIDIPELGWQLRGKFMSFEFEIVDAQGRQLATAQRRKISVHNNYDLHIIDESQTDKLVALFVVINHIVTERSESEAEGAGFAAGDIIGAVLNN